MKYLWTLWPKLSWTQMGCLWWKKESIGYSSLSKLVSQISSSLCYVSLILITAEITLCLFHILKKRNIFSQSTSLAKVILVCKLNDLCLLACWRHHWNSCRFMYCTLYIHHYLSLLFRERKERAELPKPNSLYFLEIKKRKKEKSSSYGRTVVRGQDLARRAHLAAGQSGTNCVCVLVCLTVNIQDNCSLLGTGLWNYRWYRTGSEVHGSIPAAWISHPVCQGNVC